MQQSLPPLSSERRPDALPIRHVVSTWWPLALSWVFMALEMPAMSAIMARLSNPEINLAAYGGIVLPVALIIEAPIIMLLAASTALSKDWASYVRIRRFMHLAGASLTLLHIALVFTPLYYSVIIGLIQPPPEIVEPARVGLMLFLPWTWSIAFRRFNQGVLIRFGYSRAVGVGTAVRLAVNVVVLIAGYMAGSLPGIVVGASAVSAGVLSEAAFTAWRVRPVIRYQLHPAPPAPPLTWKAFFDFYTPLVLMSVLMLSMQPIVSAALSRMPNALDSLAVWPVFSGIIFLIRSGGIAYNEVVVALLDRRGSFSSLRRFTMILAGALTLIHLAFTMTPLGRLWFGGASALPQNLTQLAGVSMWLSIPIPFLTVLHSWYQGAILYGRETRGIPESFVLSLVGAGMILAAGILWGGIDGIYVGVLALTVSVIIQAIWLWRRSRPIISSVRVRDCATTCQAGPKPVG